MGPPLEGRMKVGRDHKAEKSAAYPSPQFQNGKFHKANAVAQWLGQHPCLTLLFLPTNCPLANPIERAFGDVHDCCTRNHQRKRLADLVADVEDHMHLNGPWQYTLSDLYYEPAVTAVVEKRIAQEHAKAAA